MVTIQLRQRPPAGEVSDDAMRGPPKEVFFAQVH
jgi:hypothetical protein